MAHSKKTIRGLSKKLLGGRLKKCQSSQSLCGLARLEKKRSGFIGFIGYKGEAGRPVKRAPPLYNKKNEPTGDRGLINQSVSSKKSFAKGGLLTVSQNL